MTEIIDDDLQVNGSLDLRDDFNAGNTLYAVGRPVGSQDYIIKLVGSTTTSLSPGSIPPSVPPNETYLKVNDESMGMDKLPGINTVILNPNGTFKAKNSHNILENISQWNSWADWVNTTAEDGDVVALASYALVLSAPQDGSAENLLISIGAGVAFGVPPNSPFALLFIKGQTRSISTIGALIYPPNVYSLATLQVSYHKLLKPFSGRVGIGTAEPRGNLHIVSDGSVPLRIDNSEENATALSVNGGGTSLSNGSRRGNNTTALSVKLGKTVLSNHGYTVLRVVRFKEEEGEIAEFVRDKGDASVLVESDPGYGAYLRLKNNRVNSWKAGMDDDEQFKISYGKERDIRNSEVKLEISRNGNIIVSDGVNREVLKFDASHAALYIGSQGNEGDLIIKDGKGREVFHFDSNYAALYVGANGNEGDIIVRDGAGNERIRLDGNQGDIRLQNADCAEEFSVKNMEGIEPGTVMVLDEGDSLRPSTKAYDKKVAGVVSGAGNLKPGLVLDKKPEQTDRLPIALMGKVYCKVDAQYAPIEVGDLLTTSPTPGHAMKATDPLKAFGTVIGKALRSLDAGTGLIPILVTLQ